MAEGFFVCREMANLGFVLSPKKSDSRLRLCVVSGFVLSPKRLKMFSEESLKRESGIFKIPRLWLISLEDSLKKTTKKRKKQERNVSRWNKPQHITTPQAQVQGRFGVPMEVKLFRERSKPCLISNCIELAMHVSSKTKIGEI